MADPQIEIQVGGFQIRFREDIDRERLENVLDALQSRMPTLLANECDAAPTVADLLATSEARTFGDKAGVVAYWLEHYRGRPDWRSGDIVDALRDAAEQVPANITDALNQKLKKGLFEVHDRRWKLTGEGRGWVKYRLLRDSD